MYPIKTQDARAINKNLTYLWKKYQELPQIGQFLNIFKECLRTGGKEKNDVYFPSAMLYRAFLAKPVSAEASLQASLRLLPSLR